MLIFHLSSDSWINIRIFHILDPAFEVVIDFFLLAGLQVGLDDLKNLLGFTALAFERYEKCLNNDNKQKKSKGFFLLLSSLLVITNTLLVIKQLIVWTLELAGFLA